MTSRAYFNSIRSFLRVSMKQWVNLKAIYLCITALLKGYDSTDVLSEGLVRIPQIEKGEEGVVL